MLALDLGSRRIGMALSDPSGVLATPLRVLERGRSHAADHRAVAEVVADVGAERVVVGLPLSLDGGTGPAATAVLVEAEELRHRLAVPVELHDERFTTVAAHQALAAAGRGSRARRGVVDRAAAAVLLQSWLDRRRGEGDAR
ncbi:MAG TPA: Holliday junction resolvase RuvX [Acidimicrobiales bacterium]|nr:Holliday junction resolvase RuvX [Acidimicrobiales bacterium]